MHRMLGKLAALAILGSAAAMATTVYSNTTTDTLNTYFYSANNATELGDQITLAGTDRVANTAVVQFFNNGSAGTFDATLNLYQVGSPVGSLLGSFTNTGIVTTGGDEITVTFNALSLIVPDNLIFTLSIANAAGTDLGLEMDEPPTIGSSDNTFMIQKVGSSFSQLGTCGNPDPTPCVNAYFELDASPVPESGTFTMLGGGMVLLLGARKWLAKA